MLPKVANHILQHTSRAVTAVQNQTGHTIRSVLQLQSSSGPSAAKDLGTWNGSTSSSSGWSGSGPGTGGAKFQSSRFNSGYSTLGRSVSQADSATASGNHGESTDDDDFHLVSIEQRPLPTRAARRVRSSSLSFTIQDQDTSHTKAGVLKALQHHVRARHAFAVAPSTAAPSQSADRLLHDSDRSDKELVAQDRLIASLNAAAANKQKFLVLNLVQSLQEDDSCVSVDVYNAALRALHATQEKSMGTPSVVRTYKQMLERSVVPNGATYATMIQALTDHDARLRNELTSLKNIEKLGFKAQDPGLINRLSYDHAYKSALALFRTAFALPRTHMPLELCNRILRSCSYRGDVSNALRVFAVLKRHPGLEPNISTYSFLIQAHANAGDLQGAKDVFSEFKKCASQGTVSRSGDQELGLTSHPGPVWDSMITAYFRCNQPADALGLLEEMLDSRSGSECGLAEVPSPSPTTFHAVVMGFCESGDVKTALTWFDRLVLEGSKTPDTLRPQSSYRLSPLTWSGMFDHLALHGMVPDLNRLLEIALARQHYGIAGYKALFLYSNVQYLRRQESLGDAEVVEKLDSFFETIVGRHLMSDHQTASNYNLRAWYRVIEEYTQRGRPDRAVAIAAQVLQSIPPEHIPSTAVTSSNAYQIKRQAVLDFAHKAIDLLSPTSSTWSLRNAIEMLSISNIAQQTSNLPIFLSILDAYTRSTVTGRDEITPPTWARVLDAYAAVWTAASSGAQECLDAIAAIDLPRLLIEVSARNAPVASISEATIDAVASSLGVRYDVSQVQAVLKQLGPEFESLSAAVLIQAASNPPPTPTNLASAPSETQSVRFDPRQSRYIDRHCDARSGVSPLMAYDRFVECARTGVYPQLDVIGRLINALGRLGHADKVHSLYDSAQLVMSSLAANEMRPADWFDIEDHMIVALAHAGDPDRAHVHRVRILEQGGSPSADAYGALIQYVKDTTDDASHAMMLFQEADAKGVNKNIYIYNTMISKLAKARKADEALELFQEMKERGFVPTSVTYGAVIAACCRVGDATSAETLFQEMSSQRNFRPRIPPYNTMIQLYSQTKPDRERALYYYRALLAAGIRPSAHTYKLLLDVYGSIEPVDVKAMEDTFEALVADPDVPLLGTHWAALINSYGCVQKDVTKAIAIFESISDHPSKQHPKLALPDAVVFESLINVLVTLRCFDLLPTYTAKLPVYGVHMTAYIANLLIKGYATSGNIEAARALFESLVDPPEGVAAPNNHAVHNQNGPGLIPTDAPVYREPSTWEAMVRAELGSGNRDEAVALLERAQARRFPPAVYNRISGIMLDDSVSPWSQSPEASTPTSSTQ